jgi:hypothetical protein
METGWFFNRYKASVDIFWLGDESLEESASFAISPRKSSKTSKPLGGPQLAMLSAQDEARII